MTAQNILAQIVNDWHNSGNDLHNFDDDVTKNENKKIDVDVLPPCISATLITLLAASDWSIRSKFDRHTVTQTETQSVGQCFNFV